MGWESDFALRHTTLRSSHTLEELQFKEHSMPSNDPPPSAKNPRDGDDHWAPKNHSLRHPDRPDPTDSQSIALTRHLHRDLTATLSFFTTLSNALAAKIESQLPRLRDELKRTSATNPEVDRRIIDPDLSWNITQDSLLFSKSIAVVETLQLILHSDSVIRDPSRRTLGEVPIQLLLGKLENLSKDQKLEQLGSQSPVNSLEYVDVSLKGLFSRHKEELSKLMSSRA